MISKTNVILYLVKISTIHSFSLTDAVNVCFLSAMSTERDYFYGQDKSREKWPRQRPKPAAKLKKNLINGGIPVQVHFGCLPRLYISYEGTRLTWNRKTYNNVVHVLDFFADSFILDYFLKNSYQSWASWVTNLLLDWWRSCSSCNRVVRLKT